MSYASIFFVCWAVGLGSFHRWRQTGRELHWYFGAIAWLLAIGPVLLLDLQPAHELQPYIYSIRLIAISLTLYGIYSQTRHSMTRIDSPFRPDRTVGAPIADLAPQGEAQHRADC